MITGQSGRYAIAKLNDSTLWRHDMRWRRTVLLQPFDGRSFDYVEGSNHFVVFAYDATANSVEARLFNPDETASPVATGVFTDGAWTFTGDNSAWTNVGEHILVSGKDGNRSLLRVADAAELDPLDEIDPVMSVVDVPDSRLIVLAGSGSVAIYDPKTRHTGIRFKLANESGKSQMRFRHGDAELWLDDVDTLLKLETKNWSVIDAAGSEPEQPDAGLIEINAWSFTADEEYVLVARKDSNDVLLLSANTLEPVGVTTLAQPAHDLMWLPNGKMLAVSADGRAMRSLLRAEVTEAALVAADENSVE